VPFNLKISDPGNPGIFLANAGSAGCIPGILAYVGFDFLPSILHIDGSKDLEQYHLPHETGS